MKKRYLLLLVVAVIAQVLWAKNEWTIKNKVYEVDTIIYPHPVGPGVTFAKYDLPAMPLKVSVMTLDLTNPYIDFETCKGGDRAVAQENPLSMARRNNRPGHEVVGATNGDFYFYTNPVENGIPRSGQFRRNECVTNPVGRACFVLDENRHPYIDRVDFAGTITHKGNSYRLHTVNMQRLEWESTGGNQINLYTTSYGPATEKCSGGLKALIHPKEGNFKWWANSSETCVVDSVFDGTGVTTIPAGHAIIWAQGSCTSQLQAMGNGDEIAINLQVNLRNQPGLLGNFKELVGGSDHIIMKNGVSIDDWNDRHPRTCIGFNADSTKVYMVVIDGRSVESTGVSLGEAADVFRALGAINAVNLDGGGSSCMVVNDEVVNTPSDGSLRPVGNGCLLIANAPIDDAIGKLNFAPRCWNISTSAKISPRVWGYNQYGVLKKKDLEGCTLSCDKQVGKFENGIFIASTTPAQGNIYAEYQGIKTTQAVNIVKANVKLAYDSVVIDNKHSYEIKILGTSSYQEDVIDPSAIKWTSDNQQVATVDDHGIVTGVADGVAHITGTASNFNGTLMVSVENPKARITTIENATIDPATWTITQSGGKNRQVTALDHGMKIDFTGAASRNAYIKLAKKMRLWGMPDTLRLRFNAGELTIKRVTISTSVAGSSQVITKIDMPENIEGEYTLNLPTAQWTDVTNHGCYPLNFNYVQFTLKNPTQGKEYTFSIPGIELIYGSSTSSLNKIVAPSPALVATPNPVNTGEEVSINVSIGTILKIYDLQGRLVKQASPYTGSIATTGLSKGIYVLQVQGHTATKLVVK